MKAGPRAAHGGVCGGFCARGGTGVGRGAGSGSLTTIREDRGWVRDDNAKKLTAVAAGLTTIHPSEEGNDEQILSRIGPGDMEHRREIPRCARNDNGLGSGGVDNGACSDSSSSRVVRSHDFRLNKRTGRIACPTKTGGAFQASHAPASFSASRLVMFRMFYLGGAEYHAARRHLGISEFTWADWSEEIRARGARTGARGHVPAIEVFCADQRAGGRQGKREMRAIGT